MRIAVAWPMTFISFARAVSQDFDATEPRLPFTKIPLTSRGGPCMRVALSDRYRK
jgi:hypothetical protein